MREIVFSILLLFSVSVFAIGGGSSNSPDWDVYAEQVAGKVTSAAIALNPERLLGLAGEQAQPYKLQAESNDDSPISTGLPYEVGWRVKPTY